MVQGRVSHDLTIHERWLYPYVLETIHGPCYLKPPSCSLHDLLPGTSYGISLQAYIYPSPIVGSCNSAQALLIEAAKPEIIRKCTFHKIVKV